MEIKRTIKEYKEVGFECDFCLNSFRTGYYEDEGWKHSRKGSLSIDSEESFKYTELCEECYEKVAEFIISNGGRVNKI